MSDIGWRGPGSGGVQARQMESVALIGVVPHSHSTQLMGNLKRTGFITSSMWGLSQEIYEGENLAGMFIGSLGFINNLSSDSFR